MPPSLDEQRLVIRAREGDRGALGELVECYGGELVYALQGRAGDPETAADVAQETWVRAARGLGGFETGMGFRPWLFAIGFNALRDHQRRVQRRPEVGGEALHLAPDGPAEGERARVEEREVIAMALEAVPEPFRTAVRLVDVIGLDHAEAAASLECAEGTVKSRVSRGRRAFRLAYERLVGARGASREAAAGPRTT